MCNVRAACMQGRFSGRLQSKSDEAGLLDECPQLGPLLGGSLDPEVCRQPAFALGNEDCIHTVERMYVAEMVLHH
jgi:hypothetical protein